MFSAVETLAAPGELVIKGQRYVVRPLRECDYAELEAWVQDRHVAVVKRNLSGLPEAQQTILLQDAFNAARQITMTSKEAMLVLSSVDGSRRMLWMALRQDQPDITLERVAEILAEPDVLTSALNELEKMERRAIPPLPKSRLRNKKKKRVRR